MDSMVWSVWSVLKKRIVVHAVRDRAFLPGPAGIWDGLLPAMILALAIFC